MKNPKVSLPKRRTSTAKPSNSELEFSFNSVGIISTVFLEKFGIPRQPGLVKEARGVIRMNHDERLKNSLKGIEAFSHLWLIFVFHETGTERWIETIRPPRLGGNKKVGVLASRSPHRPNPIGLSVAELVRVDWDAPNGVEIHVTGVDLLDQTPILDIKPYIPYADSVPGASSGWAAEEIVRGKVAFSDEAMEQALAIQSGGQEGFVQLVEELLSLDPRPAFQKRRKETAGKYGFMVLNFDVRWEIQDDRFYVREIVPMKKDSKGKAKK